MRQIMTGAVALIAWAALLTGTGAAAQAATGPATERLAGASLAGARAVAGGHAAAPGGGWGKVTEVAGALNTFNIATVSAVSCPSAGNCTAGGLYESRSTGQQAFAVSETNGTWGPVITLSIGGTGALSSLSCASAGNCTAGGYYFPGPQPGLSLAFVISETNGTWGTATKVAGADAYVSSVSCPSAGNCSAGGWNNQLYSDGVAFVVNERHGTWGKITELRAGEIYSVSCPSPGNCSAEGAGFGADGQPFVADETNGTWGKAENIAGVHSSDEFVTKGSVSCASAGNCTAGGYYNTGTNPANPAQAFVVTETNGTWGTATKVVSNAVIESVSCASAGNCTAVGAYTSAGTTLSFAISQTNGTWGKAHTIRGGPAATSSGLYWVSCVSAGNCTAGGSYGTGTGYLSPSQAFVISETDGTWGKATEIAGARNAGGQAGIGAVSCVRPDYCTAGGAYSPTDVRQEAFVVSKP